MKIYNPFKPHIIQKAGLYYIRCMGLDFTWYILCWNKRVSYIWRTSKYTLLDVYAEIDTEEKAREVLKKYLESVKQEKEDRKIKVIL